MVGPVGQAVVELVAIDEEVVLNGDPRKLVLDIVVEDRAGRVGRVAKEQRLCPGLIAASTSVGSRAGSSSDRVGTMTGAPPAKMIAGMQAT